MPGTDRTSRSSTCSSSRCSRAGRATGRALWPAAARRQRRRRRRGRRHRRAGDPSCRPVAVPDRHAALGAARLSERHGGALHDHGWLMVGLASRPWLPAPARGLAFGLAGLTGDAQPADREPRLGVHAPGGRDRLPGARPGPAALARRRSRWSRLRSRRCIRRFSHVYSADPAQFGHALRHAIDLGLRLGGGPRGGGLAVRGDRRPRCGLSPRFMRAPDRRCGRRGRVVLGWRASRSSSTRGRTSRRPGTASSTGRARRARPRISAASAATATTSGGSG